MEPVAIISDIHGNLPAMQAVIADIEQQGIQERVCLGDIVGYGAQPSEYIELLRAKNFHAIIQGNHDAYFAADVDPSNMSDETAEVIRWTRSTLTPEQRAWLGALPLTWQGKDYEVVHASLHQPEQWGYVLEPAAAAQHFAHQLKPLCSIGLLLAKWHDQDKRIAAYKEAEITNIEAHDLVIRATDVGVCSNRLIPPVLHEWREPRHDAFEERNVWSLFNAFTESLKDGNLAELPKRTEALHGLLDTHVGLLS
jgi:predicted phosphodiesterase